MVLLDRLSGRRSADIRPQRTLILLGAAHAFNHAQWALLPFVYLVLIDEFGVTVTDIAFLTAVTTVVAGGAQLAYGWLTRRFSRHGLLGWGNVALGGFMALAGAASSFLPFAGAIVLSKLGGSPQHPVGNALLAEQFSPRRRGFAISAHIAGGNLGTVGVPLVAAWLIAGVGWGWTLVLFGLPALVLGFAILLLVGESGAGRAAAIAQGSLRSAFRTVVGDRDQMLILGSSVVAGGARGLGVLNLFVPLYLALVVGLETDAVALMLTVLLAGSVPGPIVAGWLSDRVGRKPVVVAVYGGGAASLLLFALSGTDTTIIWIAIMFLSGFSFVESPQLQALLADITLPGIRDAAFAVYFTLVFVASAVWVAAYGAIIDTLGEAEGLRLVFLLMAAAYALAAVLVLPIRARERTEHVRAIEEATGEPDAMTDVTRLDLG